MTMWVDWVYIESNASDMMGEMLLWIIGECRIKSDASGRMLSYWWSKQHHNTSRITSPYSIQIALIC